MTKLGIALAGASLAAMCLHGAVLAGAKIDERRITPSFDAQEIADVATALGFKAETVAAKGAGKLARITGAGVQFTAIPTACKSADSGCLGLELQMNLGAVPTLTFEQINRFNLDWVFTQAYIVNGEARISRYEIADHGIALGNIATNIGQFAGIAAKFQEFVTDVENGAPGAMPARPRS